MATVREEHPTTLEEYIRLIESLQSDSITPIWYRGSGQSAHQLLPSLYRHRSKKTIDELSLLEDSLLTRFRQRSIPFHNRLLTDDWDALFFMQHYGTPTRLLDWTENPLIALYFAVTAAKYKATKASIAFQEDACVWIMKPDLWNRKSLEHQSFDGGILAPGDDAIKGYKPAKSFAGMFNHPVALYGSHNSPRIVAQRGVFVIFGQNNIAMEKVYDTQAYPNDSLIKVIINKASLPRFRTSVFRNGITESVVFPDLEGLAREIKREFGFEF